MKISIKALNCIIGGFGLFGVYKYAHDMEYEKSYREGFEKGVLDRYLEKTKEMVQLINTKNETIELQDEIIEKQKKVIELLKEKESA